MSEELLQMLCDKENKPNAFDEFLNSLEKVALEKEQPCLSCLLRRADVRHRPRGYALEQENNGTQEQRHKSRNQNKESQSLKDDHEINNNAAGYHYDTISFSGSVYNVTIIANIQGDVQTFRNKFNRSRQRFEELDKRINPKISSHRKARVVSSRVKDELEEVEQQFQEIEEEGGDYETS
ncbi:hypothetical protein OS493_039791 [Desmophyllum pertusum]|uniref:Uncharacterized protein n=1 Tax=Desmophyllum pertusum TaxID=174260 RepID=A0A9X0D5H9_9CNID|nr:hypothetical protein OS493_039791 [Desmophyllum pertusum]